MCSGAMFSVTPNIDNFVGPITLGRTSELNGLNVKRKALLLKVKPNGRHKTYLDNYI
jgi:hypothetical protein